MSALSVFLLHANMTCPTSEIFPSPVFHLMGFMAGEAIHRPGMEQRLMHRAHKLIPVAGMTLRASLDDILVYRGFMGAVDAMAGGTGDHPPYLLICQTMSPLP